MAKRKIALVYQAGIANVFEVQSFNTTDVEARGARRLLQHAFGPCEWYAQGMAEAGLLVDVFACNRAGDIINATWTTDLDSAPFSDQIRRRSSFRTLRVNA